MSDSTQRTASTDAPDAEVELSAQELLELSPPCDNNDRAPSAPEATTTKAAPSASARRSKSTYVPLALVVSIVGALYVFITPPDGARQAQDIQQPQSQVPASTPKSEGKAVLFANPFDPNEVFEFPAGTSEAEARDAAAEILMARAMERQRQFDARVSDNR
jgi:hypothetical protein